MEQFFSCTACCGAVGRANMSSDPFSDNVQQHERFRQAGREAASRLMLVALDEELPLPALSRAANVVGPFCRGALRAHRTPARLFGLLSFLIRVTVTAQRAMRAALLRYVHSRRKQIDQCVLRWREAETKSARNLSFLEYTVAFVPEPMKKRVATAHRLRCCHEYIRATRVFRHVAKHRLSHYYDRVFALRTVSSRSSRVVRTFVECCIATSAPAFQFSQATVETFVRLCARLLYAPLRIAAIARSAEQLAALGDEELQLITGAWAAMQANPSPPSVDSVIAQVTLFDDAAMTHWCTQRKQNVPDLPLEPFRDCRSLVEHALRPIVSTSGNAADARAISEMNELFHAATRVRVKLASKGRDGAARLSHPAATAEDASGAVMNELRQEVAKRSQRVESERMMRLAVDLSASKSFERRVCLVGDAWIEEQVWEAGLTLQAVPQQSRLQSLRASLRPSSARARRALLEMQASSAQLSSLASRPARCPPTSCGIPPATPRTSRATPIHPRGEGQRAQATLATAVQPARNRSALVKGKAATAAPEPTGFGVATARLHYRGATATHPFPSLRPYLEAPVIIPAPPTEARVIATARIRAFHATERRSRGGVQS
jgi:hypothetical protein